MPIFAARADGQRVNDSVEMRNYDGLSWKPPHAPRQENGKWFADNVPKPPSEFRPAGPASDAADGCVILFDDVTGEEFDFWQVTTAEEDDVDTSRGGGVPGDSVLYAGSVSRFDVAGLGARDRASGTSRSSRASGLPYLGGLLLPEDLANGPASVIKHAFAFTLPRLRYFPHRAPTDPPDFLFPGNADRNKFLHTESVRTCRRTAHPHEGRHKNVGWS